MSPVRPGRDALRAAGGLCLVDFAGPEPSARLERLITEQHIAGVVLFRKNVVSAVQVAELTDAIQRLARAAGAPPPWVAVDHEGGAVNRFGLGSPGTLAAPPHVGALPAAAPSVTPLPSAMALGAAGDAALARAAGTVTGRELRAMGIHLNFAPVMDVNSNPANPVIGARSIGESPDLVARLGVAFIEGMQAAGVAATAKHFPGHGDVTVDSHLALPRVDHPRARLDAVELPPFAAAVRAGVAAVMSAHITFPSLDPGRVPATLSRAILTGLLRERWGFDGIVCSDSLSMRAIADHGGPGAAAVAAVRAGCDLLLALGPDAMQDEVLESLARAIETGGVSDARLAHARARLDRAAARWRVGAPRAGSLAGVVGTGEHARIARRIAEAAVTLVADRAGVIPLRGGRIGVTAVSAGAEEHDPPDLAAALRGHHAAVRTLSASQAPEADSLAEIDYLVAVTCTRGGLSPDQVRVMRVLHSRLGDRLVVVAAGDPYDLVQVPEVPAYLATYSPDAYSLDAAARVLLGLVPARGRLPVTLPRGRG
ncbi:MAG: beta-N-acetylhexosaminidase [Armatimonadota bacterium]|nr:beta-N-acetylhexosaminidase [Armatimonadota bacterium]MDR7549935.1 beta-N-acetylhexosaminidase [Armatimonadota bacterium]